MTIKWMFGLENKHDIIMNEQVKIIDIRKIPQTHQTSGSSVSFVSRFVNSRR